MEQFVELISKPSRNYVVFWQNVKHPMWGVTFLLGLIWLGCIISLLVDAVCYYDTGKIPPGESQPNIFFQIANRIIINLLMVKIK